MIFLSGSKEHFQGGFQIGCDCNSIVLARMPNNRSVLERRFFSERRSLRSTGRLVRLSMSMTVVASGPISFGMILDCPLPWRFEQQQHV